MHFYKKIGTIFKTRLPLFVFLSLYALFVGLTYRDFGISNDEPDEYAYAKQLYVYWKTRDPHISQQFKAWDGNNPGVIGYNRVYQTFLYMLNGSESFEGYHLLNFIFAGIFLILVFEFCLDLTKNQWLAILAPIFFIFTPRYLGHIPINPKDIPFLHLYLITLMAIYWLQKKPLLLEIVVLGLLFGLTQANRLIGFSLYLVYLIWQGLNAVKETNNLPKKIKQLFLKIVLIGLCAFCIQVITTPYLTTAPFKHFLDLIKININFPWQGSILLWGKNYDSTNLPWFYLPSWILATTPIFILFLSAIGLLRKKVSNNLNNFRLLLIISLSVNLSIFYLTQPVVYDGLRHMLFLVAHLVLLAWIIFVNLWQSQSSIKNKILFIALLLINLSCIVAQYFQLHPYQYSFFNNLVGSARQAQYWFATDYWGTSYKEATQMLNQKPDTQQPCLVASCGDPQQVKYYLKGNCQYTLNLDQADYLFCHTRVDNLRIKANHETLIFEIKKNGVILNKIYQLKNQNSDLW